MALEFKLPDIGEGIAEGEIVQWLVKPGDAVEEHQAVVEVMTDKATVEVPAPAAGTIAELKAAEGDVVPVGDVIFVLDTGGGAPATAPEPVPEPAAAMPAAAPSGGGGTLEFKLPDIGEGIAEGEIVQWLVAAGDTVEEHQAVVEVMTDKATVEVPAPAAGTIQELRASDGEVVPVGDVIFVMSTGAGAPVAAAAPAAAPTPAPVAAAPAPSANGSAGSNGTAAPVVANRPPGAKVLAVPSARRVARELGIELAQVPGSGRNGVIRRADVEAFAQGGAAAPAAAAPAPAAASAPAAAPAAAPTKLAPRPAAPAVALTPGERETRTPFRGVRRKIAEAMSRSMYTAPHFTIVEEVDVTELVRFRQVAKAYGAEQDVKVTFMPFIMKATAIALMKHPMLNAALDESTQEVVTYHSVDLGIATDTPNGLIVPVIRDVQAKGAMQLAMELNDLAERTRAGKVKPEELSGSTFKI
ncbi:MAG: 2-oxo acid dehydrogenase subunit E2 [Planctomycetota bacterium]|jgi:pyruvate dehydrogenase E2 component (dihydrolipoamide acetyltransferase)